MNKFFMKLISVHTTRLNEFSTEKYKRKLLYYFKYLLCTSTTEMCEYIICSMNKTVLNNKKHICWSISNQC